MLSGLMLAVNFELPIELVSLIVDIFELAISLLSLYDNQGGDLMARTISVISIGTFEVYNS